jgi:DNA polymerase/3'-5' exonuclease PolX
MFNNIYDTVTQNKLENMLGHLYADGAWCLEERTRKNGSTYLTDGPNYKRLIHIPSGICCDLFIVTDPRKWGMIYTIRTGSGVFSKDLMTWALKHHWFVQHGLLHLHRAITNEFDEVQECPDGQTCPLIADTPEEEDVFEALGLPWIEPPHRTTLIDALAMTDWLKNPTRRLHGILDRALEKALEKDVA